MLPNFEQKVTDIRKDIITMGEFIESALEDSLQGVLENDIDKLKAAREGSIKHLTYIAESVDNNVIVSLALYSPEAGELRELVSMLKTTNELIRISEAIKKYSKGMQEIVEDGMDLSTVKPYISELHSISIRSLKAVIECFKSFNMDAYRTIHIEEEKSDEVFGIFQKELLSHPPQDQETMLKYIRVIKTLKKHERITDHCENIARLIYYAKEGGRLTTRF
jgi:phosphate transport system protein